MNPTLLLLFIPMLLIAAFCRWRWPREITWLEAAGQLGIGMIVVAIVWSVSTFSATRDVETLNGQVTGKERNTVSCSHSYSCNCRTVKSGNTTSTHCDTCYEHSHDYDWDVDTTLGGFTVDRIDRQGVEEPARWTFVKNGQPVAMPHGYTNYVKGAPDSLFQIIADYKGKLPEYPGFYDYQYSDRVLGAPRDDARWNRNMAEMLKKLGPAKQVNVVLVMTDQSPRFADALRSKWIGGKKNDVIIVVGTRYPDIRWVRVFSWAKFDIANVSLRNALIDSRTLDPYRTLLIVRDQLSANYVRRPMEEFKYLEDDVRPSAWVMVLALILGTLASLGAANFFHGNDLYDETHWTDHRGPRGRAPALRDRLVRFRK